MDPDRWTEQIAGLKARQEEAAREGRAAEAEGQPVIYVHGRPYADPGAAASYDPEDRPRHTPNRREGAAIAGAWAEAAGLPLSWNPHNQPGPLRRAWAEGWTLSRAEREGASAPERPVNGP